MSGMPLSASSVAVVLLIGCGHLHDQELEVNASCLQCATMTMIPTDTFEIELGPASRTGEASIREHAISWHPEKKKYYLIADVIQLSNENHPNTYDTELYLWWSRDLVAWHFVGLAVPKGTPGVTYDGYGVASPAGMAYLNGKLYVPFSARGESDYSGRSIGLAWSGSDPEVIPWTKSEVPVSDLPGEDDDPAAVVISRDTVLHLYHRTTGGREGYRIVHAASPTPEVPSSWSEPEPVTQRPEGVRAQELTGAVWMNDALHLFVIEQGTSLPGILISHLCSTDPRATMGQAHPRARYLAEEPDQLASGGHVTAVVREGRLQAGFWTVRQSGPRYGLVGHPLRCGTIE